jgi:hypothetical protein
MTRSDDPENISAALGFVQAVREAELEEWKAAYRKGWRERNQRRPHCHLSRTTRR